MAGGDIPGPRVLLVAGSPRRHGNSERLLEACARGIAEAGGIAETLALAEREIGPCTACGDCTYSGACTISDDMTEVYAMLEDVDAIVVASPVYFSSVPAQLKAFYDRCQPFWTRVAKLDEAPRDPRRPGAFLVVRGGGDPYGFECAVKPTRSVFAVLGVEYSEDVRVDGVDEAGDIEGHPDSLEEARRVGMRLVEKARAQGA